MKVYESVWKWTFIYESIWKNLNFYESIWNCMKVHAFKYFNLYTYTSIRKKLILFLERYRKQYDPIITFKKRQWRGTKISECSIKESTMVIFTGSEILEMGLAKKFSKAWSIKSVRAWIHSVNWMIDRTNSLQSTGRLWKQRRGNVVLDHSLLIEQRTDPQDTKVFGWILDAAIIERVQQYQKNKYSQSNSTPQTIPLPLDSLVPVIGIATRRGVSKTEFWFWPSPLSCASVDTKFSLICACGPLFLQRDLILVRISTDSSSYLHVCNRRLESSLVTPRRVIHMSMLGSCMSALDLWRPIDYGHSVGCDSVVTTNNNVVGGMERLACRLVVIRWIKVDNFGHFWHVVLVHLNEWIVGTKWCS